MFSSVLILFCQLLSSGRRITFDRLFTLNSSIVNNNPVQLNVCEVRNILTYPRKMSKHVRVQTISNFNIMRIHFSSLVYGIWVLVKNFAKLMWLRKNLKTFELRGNPPSCLVDSALGQHKYVKLKVSLRIITFIKGIFITISFYVGYLLEASSK